MEVSEEGVKKDFGKEVKEVMDEELSLELSPILQAFQKLLADMSNEDLDPEFMPAEFRGFPPDYIGVHQVIFKRKGREFWVLDYRRPRVALYRVIKRKYKDEETGEEVVEEIAVHDRTVLNFVPVRIKAYFDFTIELVAKELRTQPPILYQMTIAEKMIDTLKLIELEPALPVELLDKLKELGGFFTNETLAKEAIDTILALARSLGAIESVTRPMAPGIYWNPKTKQLEAYDFDTTMPSAEEVRKALLLLDEIVNIVNDLQWRESWGPKFGKAIKWALVAGLGYAYKVYNEKRRWIPYLLLVGESQTGKTHSIGRAIAEIWSSEFTSSGSAWSLYSLSELIASQANAVVVNEAANLFRAFNKGDEEDNLFNLLKNAPEQYYFRIKSYKGSKKIYPALATFAFTANMSAPNNEAIRRRFLTIEFTKTDKIPKKAQDKFEREIIPKMGMLSAIGRFIFNNIKAQPKLLNMHWKDLAELLVETLYVYAGLKVPWWLKQASLEDRYVEELEATKTDLVASWIRRHMYDLYFRHMKHVDPETEESVRDRIYLVLEKNLSPYFTLRSAEVLIHPSILNDMQRDLKLDIYNFTSFCELMGWEYKVRSFQNKKFRVGVAPLKDFLDLVAPPDEEEIQQKVSRAMDMIVDMLAMGPAKPDEIRERIPYTRTIIDTAVEELKTMRVIFLAGEELHLDVKRAKSVGFNVAGVKQYGGTNTQ